MSATEPWSGHYSLQPTLFVVMHTAQFTDPAVCHYLENAAVGANNGFLDFKNASSAVVFDCGSWFTMVIETSVLPAATKGASSDADASTRGAGAGTTVEFTFTQLPAALKVHTVQVWETCEDSMFKRLPDAVLSAQGTVAVTIHAACVLTVTSSTAMGASIPLQTIPASKPFPPTHADNFNSYAAEQTVKYFTDEAGSFNAAPVVSPSSIASSSSSPASVDMMLKQVVTQHPINGAWWGTSYTY